MAEYALTATEDLNQPDILFLRHARSGFNQGELDFFKKHPHIKYSEAAENEEFKREVLFSEKYIDTYLSPAGIEQCQHIKNDPTFDKVKVVLVSPFNRTLETAKLIFGQRNIPLIVHPQLAESFRYGCDLTTPIQIKKEQFSQFDFRHIQGLGQYWYIESSLNSQNREALKELLQKIKKDSLAHKQRSICSMVASKGLYETNEQLKDRTFRMKKILQDYKKCYDKIAVVAHMWSLRFLMSPKFDKNSFPSKLLDIQNAKPYWISLAKLLPK